MIICGGIGTVDVSAEQRRATKDAVAEYLYLYLFIRKGKVLYTIHITQIFLELSKNVSY